MEIIVNRDMRVSGIDYKGGVKYPVTDIFGQYMITAGFAVPATPIIYNSPGALESHLSVHSALGILPGNRVSNGPFLIPFGDSHINTMWKQLLPSTVTASGGIATVTMATAPAISAGDAVRLSAFAYAGFNGTKTVLTTPSSLVFTFAVPMDAPASETVVGQVANFSNDRNFSSNFINYLQAYSKGRFYIPKNSGTGGDSSGQALARLNNDVLQYQPDRVLILLGTNDAIAATSTSITSFITNMTSIYTQCLNAGIAVDACTIPPIGAGHPSVSSPTVVGWMCAANRWIRDYANRTKGIKLHDVYNWITDPVQANGQALTGYLSDTVHFAAPACKIVSKNMAANYTSWLGVGVDRLPSSQADGYTFDITSKNRFLNHFFQGTTVATNWNTLWTGTSNSQVNSCVARTVANDGDILGNNQQSDLTSVAGNGGTHLVYQDPSARLVAGNRYKGIGQVRVALGTIGAVNSCHITFGFTVDGIARTYRAGLSTIPEDGSYVFETPEFVWPAGATNPIFYLSALTPATTAGNTVSISWGRVGLIDVT